MTEDAIRVSPRSGSTPGRRHEGIHLPVPSELIVLGVAILAVLLAALIADDFGATSAWSMVTVLASAYMLSRGLAKHEQGHHGID